MQLIEFLKTLNDQSEINVEYLVEKKDESGQIDWDLVYEGCIEDTPWWLTELEVIRIEEDAQLYGDCKDKDEYEYIFCPLQITLQKPTEQSWYVTSAAWEYRDKLRQMAMNEKQEIEAMLKGTEVTKDGK